MSQRSRLSPHFRLPFSSARVSLDPGEKRATGVNVERR